MPLDALEGRLGHAFASRALLEEALTHSSHAHERGGRDNERLEFLGDAILSACTTLLLLERFPVAPEGELSRLRSRLVNTVTLAQIGRDLGLGELLLLGRGEAASGGRDKVSVLADVTEAVLGSVYQDAGFAPCLAVVRAWMTPRLAVLEQDVAKTDWKDPRSLLQELTQRRWRQTPRYVVTACTGPDHAPLFDVDVALGDQVLGRGTGSSKRDAARQAASRAFDALCSSTTGPDRSGGPDAR
jgi:ribonuclease-3